MGASQQILVGGRSASEIFSLNLGMANRHGLITGATGTGKTVTLRTLAEGFSRNGVPVFTADVKGDLSGLALAGSSNGKIEERKTLLGLSTHQFRAYPTLFWDVFGKSGHPLRATMCERGPILLSRLLDLNDVQDGVLTLAFKVADDQGLPVLDLKDVRELVVWCGENADELQQRYGNVAKASIGAIQRSLLSLEQAGGDRFFGEPALKLDHLMKLDFSGNGVISVLDATTLIQNPQIYSTLLLWLLSELFEQLPEVGDLEKPKMVFFFDEAHLLFANAPKSLLDRIEQVVRLIRSKGVGIYFVTQSPLDVPENIAGQLGNRVQHALRAFTPRDQKAVQAAAETFRPNPKLNTAQVISELAVGEALVSFLDPSGTPTPVERVWIAPPESRLGAITPTERQAVIDRSPIKGTYEETIDRESAYELLQKRRSEHLTTTATPSGTGNANAPAGIASGIGGWLGTIFGQSHSRRATPMEALVNSTARSIGNQLARQIVRGVMGSLVAKSR